MQRILIYLMDTHTAEASMVDTRRLINVHSCAFAEAANTIPCALIHVLMHIIRSRHTPAVDTHARYT